MSAQQGFTHLFLILMLLGGLIIGAFVYKNIPSIQKGPISDIPLQSLQGKLLITSKNKLIAVDPDGNNPHVILDLEEKHYIGVRDQGRVIYYTEKHGTAVSVFKKNIAEGETIKVFTFDNKDASGNYDNFSLDVSPDQNFIVYPDGSGLAVYDLEKNTNKKVLTDKECEDTTDCWGYDSGVWSPDGKKIIVKKIYYEGAASFVIDPFSPLIKEEPVGPGAHFIWTPDGKILATVGSSYSEPSVIIFVDNLYSPNLNNPLEEKLNSSAKILSVVDADWLNNNQIVFGYTGEEYNSPDSHVKAGISLYDLKNDLLTTLIELEDGREIGNIWVTSDNTIIVKDRGYEDYQDKLSEFWEFNLITKAKQKLPLEADSIIGIVR